MCEVYKRSLNAYNTFFTLGIILAKVKIVRVKPLHKNRDIHNVQNYIPISVLTVFSKTLEKMT